jgi:prophage regulatory protein
VSFAGNAGTSQKDMLMPRRLLKLNAVRDVTALGSTSVYKHVKAGTFPPPIKLTTRSSAWVEDEVAAVNEARIAGKSDDDLRRLVARLVAQRQQPAAA